MQKNGIAAALWSAARRLIAVPGGARSALIAFAAAAVFAGSPTVALADVEYDYTGTDFTNFFCTCVSSGSYTTADKVTGDIVLANPLPPSSVTYITSPSQFSSFSFSDGVDTITPATIAASTATDLEFGGAIDTNAAGQITSAALTFQAGNTGVGSYSETIAVTPTGSYGNNTIFPSKNGQGTSSTPGTWSGPITVSSPGPSLYLTATAAGNQSLTPGDQVSIVANVTVATTQPPGSVLLPVTLPPGATTIQQVADDLGYSGGLGWIQTITIPSPSPYVQCLDLACSSSAPLGGTTTDPPLYGWTYCALASPSCTGYYPFYNSLTAPCASYSSPGVCATPLFTNGGSTLNFYDSPSDLCLSGPLGSPGLAYSIAVANALVTGAPIPCGGMITPADSALVFQTELVGVLPTFVPNTNCIAFNTCVVLGEFDWTDNFNGTSVIFGTGGVEVSAVADSNIGADPSTGTGGVTLVSINGVPVPEPASLALLLSAILTLLIIRRNGERVRSHPRPSNACGPE